MKLALIYGGKSQKIAETIKTIKDNLDIDCFKDIAEFIDMTLKRRIMYDRVLMPTTVVDENSLGDLEQFWRSNLYNTSIVLLCKKNLDENIGGYFKKHFVSTNVCAMFVDSSQRNSTVLSDAIIMPMTKLNEKYGLDTELDLEDDDGVVLNVGNNAPAQNNAPEQVQNNMPVTQEAPAMQPNEPVVEQPQPPVKEKKRGRKSLFGKKTDEEPVPQPMQQPVQQVQPQVQQQVQPNQMPPQMQNQAMPMQQQMQQPFVLQTPDMSMWPTPEQVMPELQMMNMQQGMTQQNNGYDYQGNFGDGNAYNNQNGYMQTDPMVDMGMSNGFDMQGALMNMPNDVPTMSEPMVDNTVVEPVQGPMTDTFVETPLVQNNMETPVEPTVEPTVEPEVQPSVAVPVENTAETPTDDFDANFEPLADDDFGNVAMGNFDMPTQSSKPVADAIEEVSEDLGGIDLSGAESAYRAQNEQPKIITKEIVREVVRDSGGGGGIVNSILKGKNPHVLIVTGDRGTGITSTCLSIASFFCKSTSVLYFDCDTHTHGVLSYINYEEFRNFEPTKMSGTKICKSSKVFDNCVCKFDDNFDILSSDYSVDVAPEELTCTASVVAEKVVDYGLVIVDCPAENLHCISDLLISGNTIVCIDASKRGFMNMLCALESSTLSLRYKKLMVNKGIMFLTKYNKNIDVKRIVAYVKSIYEPEGVDWLAMHSLPFMGKVDLKILDRVFTK